MNVECLFKTYQKLMSLKIYFFILCGVRFAQSLVLRCVMCIAIFSSFYILRFCQVLVNLFSTDMLEYHCGIFCLSFFNLKCSM